MDLNTSAVATTFWNGHFKNLDIATTHPKQSTRKCQLIITEMQSRIPQVDHTYSWTSDLACHKLLKK